MNTTLTIHYRQGDETLLSHYELIHSMPGKNYPNQARFNSDLYFYGFQSKEVADACAIQIQRYVRFTEALQMQTLDYFSHQICERADLHDSRVSTDHVSLFRGDTPKEWCMFDAPYNKDFHKIIHPDWKSAWLPRGSDPYSPGKTFGRLSVHKSSRADLDELVNRVSKLNFELSSN